MLQVDLHIVYGEVAVYVSRLIDKSDNGAASMGDGQHLGALSHASDTRGHCVKIGSVSAGGGRFVLGCLRRGSWATASLTAARLKLISNGRTRHTNTGGQRRAGSCRRGQKWGSSGNSCAGSWGRRQR